MPSARRHVVPSSSRARNAALLVRRGNRAPAPRSRSMGGIILGVIASVALAIVVLTAAGAGVAGLIAASSITVLSKDLPDPTQLESLSFAQPTVLYDRTGTHQLATFQQEQRSVLAFDQ